MNYYQLGNQYYNDGRYDQAEKSYKKSINCSTKYSDNEYDYWIKHNI